MGPKIYHVTPEQMANFRIVALQSGITVPDGNEGQIETHGVTMSFSYDGAANLTLTIMSKPFYIPASMVWDELQPYLTS